MSNDCKPTGTIFFKTATQLVLWKEELTGQLSDGMWEGARPHDHWRFWCRLDAQLDATGEARVETPNQQWEIKKRSYAFTRLIEHIEDRMLALGRMARAAEPLGALHLVTRGTAEYMPDTLEGWRRCKETGAWQYSFVGDYMAPITDELAAAFYAAAYTPRELRRDLIAIAKAVKNVR